MDEERKCNDTNKITRIKNVITYQILDIQKEISNSFCKGSIKDKFVKAKISDEFIAKKKEELLNKEALRIKNKLLSDEYFEYYLTNSFEERSVKDYFNALLKFHPLILSGISLVGMIYYFAYFGLELKYFPDLGGADVAYIGVLIFCISAFLSLSIILPCLFYPSYHKKDVGWIFFFGLTLLPFFTLIFAAALNYIDTNKIPFNIIMPYSLGGSIIYLCLVILADKKINTNKNDILITFLIFLIFLIIILLLIAQYFFKIEWTKLDTYFWFTMIGLFIVTLSYFKGLEYFYNQNDYITPVMAISIIVIAILSWCSLGLITNKLGIANVEYKYLSIEKSTLGALPKGIYDISKIAPFEKKPVFSYIDNNLTMEHDEKNNTISYTDVSHKYIQFGCEEKNCNDIKDAINIEYKDKKLSYTTKDKEDISKENNFTIETTANLKTKDNITYTEESKDIIWLHNIKAISTLGKFYYLETKDGTKFELDASKIISRKK
ncbi:hypothetical protein [Campylobacter concisus]